MDSATSQPNLRPSNKSAARIREMLEAVRGRVASVVGHSTVSDLITNSKIPTKKSQLNTSNERNNDKELLLSVVCSIEDDVKFLKDKLTHDFERTRERMRGYLGENSFDIQDCLCNILNFSRQLKEESLSVTKEKCALKRSSTMNSRLPSRIATTRRVLGDRQQSSLGVNIQDPIFYGKQPHQTSQVSCGSRASFEGYQPNERRQSSLVPRNIQQSNLAPSRSLGASKLTRTSSTCSSIVKSSMSSLSSQATTGANTSSATNSSENEDLHHSLMKLLNENNSRLHLVQTRASIGSTRSEKLIDI